MEYRNLFPIFEQTDIYYLDSGATSQKPISVINAIKDYYKNQNGNPGRGSHRLSMENSVLVDEVRKKVKEFINAEYDEEIIFVKNATEGLNLIAYSYALWNLNQGDEIILAISNHHANIVPWQIVAKKTGAILQYIYLDENGQLDISDLKNKITSKTKIVSVSAVANATGVIQDFRKVIEISKKVGAITVVDAAQSISHYKHDVKDWDVDFLVFSGHKMFAAMGVGILYGKKYILESMEPFIYGGNMIDFVEEQDTVFTSLPNKFEAGTKDMGSIVSLGKAIDFINEIGYNEIDRIEKNLLEFAYDKLSSIPEVEIYHHKNLPKAGVIAFNVKGVHSHDTAYILDTFGVMVRSGHHCAQPLMKYLGISSCCRASFGIYNTEEDVERLVLALKKVKEVFLG